MSTRRKPSHLPPRVPVDINAPLHRNPSRPYDKKLHRASRGVPGNWRPEFEDLIYKFALLGANDTTIAELLGVKPDNFSYWKTNRPEVAEALRQGRSVANANVAKALYKRAVGYEYTEELKIKNKAGEVSRTEISKKKMPGDVAAQKHWLSVREKETWADVSRADINIKHTGTVNIANVYDQLQDPDLFSIDELQVIRKLGVLAEANDVDVRNN